LALFGVINNTHLSRTSDDAIVLSRNWLYACSSLRRPDFAMTLEALAGYIDILASQGYNHPQGQGNRRVYGRVSPPESARRWAGNAQSGT
jgi:hypothetical protein